MALRRLPGNDDLPLPAPATAGSSGVDLRAALAEVLVLRPGERRLVPTGFAVAIPEGFEGQVRPRSGAALKQGLALPDGYVALVHPRSGLAARHGLSIVNAPGTVDAGYRGEIKVLLINHDPAEPIELRRGDRIAQLVIAPVARARFEEVAELPPTDRGAGGFGHTGTT